MDEHKPFTERELLEIRKPVYNVSDAMAKGGYLNAHWQRFMATIKAKDRRIAELESERNTARFNCKRKNRNIANLEAAIERKDKALGDIKDWSKWREGYAEGADEKLDLIHNEAVIAIKPHDSKGGE